MIKNIFAKIFGSISNSYSNIISAAKQLYHDGRDFIDYIDTSLENIAYHSPGLVGAYNDIRTSIPVITNKYNALRDDFRNLESIIFGTKQPYSGQSKNANTYAGSGQPPNSTIPFMTGTPITRNQQASGNKTEGPSTGTSTSSSNDSTKASSKGSSTTNIGDLARKYTKNQINNFIEQKNRYIDPRYAGLEDKINAKIDFIAPLDQMLNDVMFLKANDKNYSDLSTIRYDVRYAPKKMKKEIVDLYKGSDMTLKEISGMLDKKYGMHISARAISRDARQYLAKSNKNRHIFKNRKQVKAYYGRKP